MTLDYQVRGMSLAGLTRPGPQVVTVTAGHIQLAVNLDRRGEGSRLVRRRSVVASGGGDRAGGGRFKVAFHCPSGAAPSTAGQCQ